jgi:hypothetical protein
MIGATRKFIMEKGIEERVDETHLKVVEVPGLVVVGRSKMHD